MSKRVSINTVAKRAGVSRGTVDRVLNQRPHVKPEVREAVIHAMKELGYRPVREEQATALGLPLAVGEEEALRLGILLTSEGGYYESEIMRGVQDVQNLLSGFAVEILVRRCTTNMADEAIEKMEELADAGARGLAVCAPDREEIAEEINALIERGLAIVTFNSDISGCRRLCCVGENIIRSGRVAGDLMAKLISKDDSLLIAIGNPEFNGHRLRLQGFCERIYELGFSGGNLEIIETYNDYSLTRQRVGEAMRRKPEIRGIYMANHSVTGCVEALRTIGKSGQIHVISHDLTDATRRLLKLGEIDFTIAQDLYQQGYRALLILWEYLNGQQLSSSLSQGIQVICAENIDT